MRQRTDRLSLSTAAVNELLPCSLEEVPDPKQEDWRAALLAGEVLMEIGQVKLGRERTGQFLLERTRGWLKSALQQDQFLDPRQRADAGRLLARLNDPRPRSDLFRSPCLLLCPCRSLLDGRGQRTASSGFAFLLDFPFSGHQCPVQRIHSGRWVFPPPYWAEARQARIWKEGDIQGRYNSEPRSAPVDYGEPYNLPNHPVMGLTWYEAMAYTRWLAEVLRRKAQALSPENMADPERSLWEGLRLGNWSVALPSEAEWEKAARGGHPSPLTPLPLGEGRGLVYPWGDEFDPNKANTSETGIDTTSAVGCFPGGASSYGVEDLSGNVWEWTRSLYQDYPYPADEPGRAKRENLAAPKDTVRVLRGGSFNHLCRGTPAVPTGSGTDPDLTGRDSAVSGWSCSQADRRSA